MTDLKVIEPVFHEVALIAPFKGKTVGIISGKHKGIHGVVFWHGRDRFTNAFRYGDNITHHIRECAGRYGYRIGIKTEEGNVFVPADDVIVCVAVSL